MATKPSFSENEKNEARRLIMSQQFGNMIRAHAKQFALIIKMLLDKERKEKKPDEGTIRLKKPK